MTPAALPDPSNFCTAVLMTNQWVLTSKQCFGNLAGPFSFTFQVDGVLGKSTFSTFAQRKNVRFAQGSDLAIAMLNSPVPQSLNTDGFVQRIYPGTAASLLHQPVTCYGHNTATHAQTSMAAHIDVATDGWDNLYQFSPQDGASRFEPIDTGGPCFVQSQGRAMLTGIHWRHNSTQTVMTDTSLLGPLGQGNATCSGGQPPTLPPRDWVNAQIYGVFDNNTFLAGDYMPFSSTANGPGGFIDTTPSWHLAHALTSTGSSSLDLYTIGMDKTLFHAHYADWTLNSSTPPNHRSVNGGWSDWERASSAALTNPRGIAAVRWASPDQTHVVARDTGRLLFTQANGTVFGPWTLMSSPPGLSITTDPAMASYTPGHIDLFACASDNALWHTSFNNGSWTNAWNSWGGACGGAPAAVLFSPGVPSVDVVIRGAEGLLWHLWSDHDIMANAQSIGGPYPFASQPAITSSGGRMDVFLGANGDANDHQLLQITSYDGATWSPWVNLGYGFAQDPAAFARSSDHLHVVNYMKDDSTACLALNTCPAPGLRHLRFPTKETYQAPAGYTFDFGVFARTGCRPQ